MSDFGDKALGQSMAKAAAIGAVVAIPIPFVGPIIGAAAGAGYAYYKSKKRP
jgi:predicted PurR-regulated permease PerM